MQHSISSDPLLARLISVIATRTGAQRFNIWFGSTQLVLKQESLEIIVPDEFTAEQIGRKFTAVIEEAAVEVLGAMVPVRFSIGSRNLMTKPVITAPDASVPKIETNNASGDSSPSEFDLSAFIVGLSNREVYRAVRAVVETPNAVCNALFVHGACGVGKTHLLRGLCQAFTRQYPSKRCLYLTGEEFAREFQAVSKANRLEIFRRKTRDLDMLVVDDVHLLSGEHMTQAREELEYALNAVLATGRRIVFSSAHHSKVILEGLGTGFLGNFKNEAIIRIGLPDKELRLKLLRMFCQKAGLVISEDVIAWIAGRVTSNARELRGVVTRLTAHHKQGGMVDLSSVSTLLADLQHRWSAPVDPENVIAAVCERFGLEPHEIKNGKRDHVASVARSLAMYILRNVTNLSFPEVGNFLGGRNHSTAISACRRVKLALDTNEALSWSDFTGDHCEAAKALVEQLEERSRTLS